MSAKTLVNFTDHPRKKIFRNHWAKPLLEHISKKLDSKLIYMGLPGVEALDIKEWIEYLNVVFAFQCLDDDKDIEVAEAEYASLDDYLNSLTVKGKLKDYGLYKGFLEQIIMTGYDEAGSEFNQFDHVTVYNLDFCNPLTSPYLVVYPDKTTGKCLKIDTVDKLLEIQNTIDARLHTDKFLMFLTVNSLFFESDYDEINVKEFKAYKRGLSQRTEKSRNVRLLRAYTFFHLNRIFNKNNYQAEFLPTMYYAGSGVHRVAGTNQRVPTMMLTFTILGTKITDGGTPLLQDLNTFLNCKFLFATDTALSCYTENRISETDFDLTPTVTLETSATYTKLWEQTQTEPSNS